MKFNKDDFELDVVEFDEGVYLRTGMEQSDARELTKQILDDYEKARKYPKLVEENQSLKYERIDLMSKLRQNQKLRELIEKKIENLPGQIEGAISTSWKADYELLLIEFKSLLKDSEK